jgi:hypothetical protein
VKEEVAMSLRLQLCTLAAGMFLSVAVVSAATASQGPGTAPGTASSSTQLAMAIVIYGGAALILAASLVVAIRRRFSKR